MQEGGGGLGGSLSDAGGSRGGKGRSGEVHQGFPPRSYCNAVHAFVGLQVLSEMHQRWQRANANKIGDRPLFEEDDKEPAIRDIMRDWAKQTSKEGHGGGHGETAEQGRSK